MMIISVFYTNAQNYRQFPNSNDNPLWVIKTTYPYLDDIDTIYCSYMGMLGDTIINLKNYEKIYYLNDTIVETGYISSYFGALREELKKLYLLRANEDKEKLIFDFSKNINDTILIDSAFIPPLPIVLNNVDTLLLNGSDYIRYTTSCGDKWIEGIGNTEWDIFNICPPVPTNGSYTRLSCFKLNNTVIYGKNCKCEKIITNIIKSNQSQPIEFFPNPASDYLSFKFNNTIKSNTYKIEIIDIEGKVVFEDLLISNNNLIKLDKINSGIYIIRVILKDSIYSNMLIINKNKR